MSVIIALAALGLLMLAAYRGYSVILFAPLAALGATLTLLGVLGLSMVGFAGLLEGRTALLIAIPVTAPAAVAMTLCGWLLVERAGRGRGRGQWP